MSAATAPRHAPIALWRIAQTFLHALYALFGNPEDIAAQHTLTAKTHALMLDWLRTGEAILRKLLLIEAAALECSASKASASRQRPQRQRKLMQFFAERPEQWRVCFRYGATGGRRLPAGNPAHQPAQACANQNTAYRLKARVPRPFHDAWPLAERFEALIRVFNDPAPYAARLARRLRAKPARAQALLREPPRIEYTLDPVAREALTTAAEPAARSFTDTT